MTEALNLAAEMISQADSIIIAAGAGMGADSGLPTFRGNDGFWKAYPALSDAQFNFQSIACPDAFYSHPQLAWGFYAHRLSLYRETRPHTGFDLLKKWGEQKIHGAAVFTSNVDGQFQKAGFSSDLIDECHGSIHYLQCLNPCCDAIWPADEFIPVVDEKQCLLLNEPPHCPHCGALARPNIMMFGDYGWIETREIAQSQKLQAWLKKVARPIIIEIGAGMAIPSVRFFSQQICQKFDAFLVRINLDEQTARLHNEKEITFHSSSIGVLKELDRLMNS
jgi:NAD-dependent protein deacetylases, SIR2 family